MLKTHKPMNIIKECYSSLTERLWDWSWVISVSGISPAKHILKVKRCLPYYQSMSIVVAVAYIYEQYSTSTIILYTTHEPPVYYQP